MDEEPVGVKEEVNTAGGAAPRVAPPGKSAATAIEVDDESVGVKEEVSAAVEGGSEALAEPAVKMEEEETSEPPLKRRKGEKKGWSCWIMDWAGIE